MENRIEEKIDAIQTELKSMNGKIDKLQTIEIRNGGGRHIQYKRDEFFQMLYDKNKNLWNNMASFSDKALKVGKFITFALLSLYALSNIINGIGG